MQKIAKGVKLKYSVLIGIGAEMVLCVVAITHFDVVHATATGMLVWHGAHLYVELKHDGMFEVTHIEAAPAEEVQDADAA